jgi:hypothetical protein
LRQRGELFDDYFRLNAIDYRLDRLRIEHVRDRGFYAPFH